MTEPAPGPAPTRLIVAPWARLEDLPESLPKAHDDVYGELLWQASEMLYHLTGRQWAGQAERSVLLAPYRAGRCWTQTEKMVAASWPTPLSAVLRDAASQNEWRSVQLPDPPIVAVDEVLVDDEPLIGGWWAQLPVGLLHRDEAWPARGVQVRYRHGLAPPAGGKQSAIILAAELARAWAGDDKCRLPRKIQTITREGVTMSFGEQFEHLDKGRLGIFEIDSWIASVNPYKLQRRARVWTPDTAGRRRT